MLRVGALFAGIGGIELGLERTGYFKTEWFVEIDEFCRRVLQKHWSGTPIYTDIRTVEWDQVPPIDMLTGGFPCQDISCANPKAEGISGSRSGLWKEYAKAIGILRPKYTLIENVPAITRKGLNVVLADLAEAGYDAEWFNLRASDIGAPHKRERIFVIAYPCGETTWVEEPRSSGQKRKPAGGTQREVVRQKDGATCAERTSTRTSPNPRFVLGSESRGDGERGEVRGVARREDSECTTPNFDAISRHKISSGELDAKGCIITDGLLNRIQRFTQRQIQRKQGFSVFEDVRRVEDITGRQDLPEPLFRGSRDGIPDWVDRIKSLGNAVVPQCAEVIGEMIMEADR